ncbi:MAG: Ig-like domain-containing protein, partial [Planctomycetota bacterium]
MSRFSRFSRKARVSNQHDRRRTIQLRKKRKHFLQQLERRDHPGGLLESGLLGLLGEPEGDSNDANSQLLRSADGIRARRELYQRLTHLRGDEPFRTDAAERLDDWKAGSQASRDARDDEARRLLHDRLTSLFQHQRLFPAANRLLDSVTQSDLGLGLDDTLPGPTESSTRSNDSIANATGSVQFGPGNAQVGSFGSGSFFTLPTDRAGSEGSALPTVQSGGSSGGGGADSETPATQSAAEGEFPPGPGGGGPGGPGQGPEPPSPEPEEEILRPETSDILAATRTSDSLTVTTAATTNETGDGAFIVVATIGAQYTDDQIIDAIAVRNGVETFLGTLDVDQVAGDATLVGTGTLDDGDEVTLHRHTGDGLVGDVSTTHLVVESTDDDNDNVSEELELLVPDGNGDGILDAEQPSVTTLPDSILGEPITLDGNGFTLTNVGSAEPQVTRSFNRLPMGLFEFELNDVPFGSVQSVDVYLDPSQPTEGWFKENIATGRLSEFIFDGTTGAVKTDFGYTLYLQDGGRGDDDGLVNGVILDPGGPGFAGSITVTDDRDEFVLEEFGGTDGGKGGYREVVYGGRNIDAVNEGDSLLTTVSRTIVIPDNPSWLIFGFEAGFDANSQGQINDAFEVALLDAEGYSVVPTYVAERDSYFNITEEAETRLLENQTRRKELAVNVPEAVLENEFVTLTRTDDESDPNYISGFVDLDISNVLPGQEVTLAMRLVNNDGDRGSWFRITNERPIPVANDDNYQTVQNQSLLVASDNGLLVNDFDGDDSAERPLAVALDSIVHPPANQGTVTVYEDGGILFTPANGYFNVGNNGTPDDPSDDEFVEFTYYASNGLFSSPTPATVRIHVQKENLPPVAVDDNFGNSNEDTPVSVAVLNNDSDPNGDELSVVAIGQTPIETGETVAVANATIQLESDGTLTVTPAENYNGSIGFQYTVSDGSLQATANVTGTIVPVNDPPTGQVPNRSGLDGAALTSEASAGLIAFFSDPDADAISISEVTGMPRGLTYDAVNDRFEGTYSADASADSPYAVSVTAIDGLGGTVTEIFQWSVNNPAPVANDDTFFTTANASLVDENLYFPNPDQPDYDDDSFFVSTVGGLDSQVGAPVVGSSGGLFTIQATGLLSFDPAGDFDHLTSESDETTTISYVLLDAQNASSTTAQVTIRVTGVNDPPEGQDKTISIGEDIQYQFTESDFGFSDPVDSPPDDFRSVVISTLPDSAAGVLRLNGVDVQAGDEVNVSLIDQLRFVPVQDLNGTALAPFTFQVRDDGGVEYGGVDLDPTPNTIQFDVAAVNDPPTAVNDSYVTNEDLQLVVDAASGVLDNDTDLDGDVLTVSVVDSTQHGALSPQLEGNFTYTPNANFYGTDFFTYRADDGSLQSELATATITVLSVNDPPAGADQTIPIDENTSYSFVASDFGFIDPVDNPADALQSVVITTLPNASEGTLKLGGVAVVAADEIATVSIPNLVFEPANNVTGTSLGSFTFQVRDDGGTDRSGVDLDGSPNTIDFNIASTNVAPVAVPDAYQTDEDLTLVVTPALGVLENDSDPDGDPIIATIQSNPDHGRLELDDDGGFTYWPDANYHGSVEFTYFTSDDEGLRSATVTVSIDVLPVNDPPVAADKTIAMGEDDTHAFASSDFGFEDPIDVPGDDFTALQITTLPSSGEGTLTFQASAVSVDQWIPIASISSLVFTPLAPGQGIGEFTFRVQDDGGTVRNGVDTSVSPNTIAFDVTPQNDPPVALADTFSTTEDTAVLVPVLVNDSDPNGDAIDVVSVNATSLSVDQEVTVTGGVIKLLAGGVLRFTPDAGFTGSTTFDYSISDGELTASATVSGTVTASHSGFCYPFLDFDRAPNGNETAGGLLAADLYADWGVTISSKNPNRPAMLFESALPTGGDSDLGSPNQDFGGPGKGTGGQSGQQGENSLSHDRILIISEDGDASDPDDNARGGTLVFDFDSLTTVHSVGLLDIDDTANVIRIYDANGDLINSIHAADVGNNSYQRVAIDASGVSRMEVDFIGSGAVTDLQFCADGAPPPVSYTITESVDEGNTVSLSLTSGQTISSVFVDWGDGIRETIDSPSGPITHTYQDGDESKDVYFYAITSAGVQAADALVTVQNVAPTLTISAPATVGQSESFQLDLSDVDQGQDTIYAWLIDWNDGSDPQWVNGNPESVQHEYAAAGNYVISAIAYDEDSPHAAGIVEVAGRLVFELRRQG